MRWFGTVYTPMMAVLGLLFIVLSFVKENTDTISPSTMMLTGAILAAGACISGAIRHAKDAPDDA